MKKEIITLVILLTTTLCFSQSQNDNVKKALSTIYRYHHATSVGSNVGYYMPKEYIYLADGNVQGQVFEKLGNITNRYDTLIVTEYESDKPIKIKRLNDIIEFEWAGDKIVKINNIKGRFTVHQMDGSRVVTFAPIRSDNLAVTYPTVLYADGRIEMARSYNKKNYDKDVKLVGQNDFSYEGDTTILIENYQYKPKVNPTTDDLLSVKKAKYILEPTKLTVLYSNEDRTGKVAKFTSKETTHYNIEGKGIKREYSNSKGDGSIEEYEYINGELFKTKGKLFLEKNSTAAPYYIIINFDNPTQNSNLPNYEQKKGRYEFDVNNDLIYEQNDTMHRYKTNGVWEAWKYRHM